MKDHAHKLICICLVIASTSFFGCSESDPQESRIDDEQQQQSESTASYASAVPLDETLARVSFGSKEAEEVYWQQFQASLQEGVLREKYREQLSKSKAVVQQYFEGSHDLETLPQWFIDPPVTATTSKQDSDQALFLSPGFMGLPETVAGDQRVIYFTYYNVATKMPNQLLRELVESSDSPPTPASALAYFGFKDGLAENPEFHHTGEGKAQRMGLLDEEFLNLGKSRNPIYRLIAVDYAPYAAKNKLQLLEFYGSMSSETSESVRLSLKNQLSSVKPSTKQEEELKEKLLKDLALQP